MNEPRPLSHRLLLMIGSLGPLGHVPASGSVTVLLVGLPLFRWLSSCSSPVYAFFTLTFSAAAIGIHQIGDRLLGEKDSRRLVWDELAGFLVAGILVPFSWPVAALAFVLERTLDIAKVPPANWIEKHWPGGLGVVGDDLIAGLYTCGILHLLLQLGLFP